ncbi:hypothetical protein GGR50DRAFT_698692 [Xylaria sp. CBS 124048]|nr:hypothetical protein GGR50DRAFT_698692 [Xylaria sp. CBS 124048]
MVWAWQLWLSPRPLRRTNISSQLTFKTIQNAALYQFLDEEDGGWGVRETHYIDNPLVRAGLSGPPLHIHLIQDEFFKIEQGVLGVITDGTERALTKDDGILKIPAGTRHRFWCHKSSTENLVFHGWIDPQDKDYILDKNYLRHLQGYIADCDKANVKPSIFQIILFSYHASTVLSPPFWVPLWLLNGTHYILANWIAQGLLGYKPSYPEYTEKARSE